MITVTYIEGLRNILAKHPRSSIHNEINTILSAKINETYQDHENLNLAIETVLSQKPARKKFFGTSLSTELRNYMSKHASDNGSLIVDLNLPATKSVLQELPPVLIEPQVESPANEPVSPSRLATIEEEPTQAAAPNNSLFLSDRSSASSSKSTARSKNSSWPEQLSSRYSPLIHSDRTVLSEQAEHSARYSDLIDDQIPHPERSQDSVANNFGASTRTGMTETESNASFIKSTSGNSNAW